MSKLAVILDVSSQCLDANFVIKSTTADWNIKVRQMWSALYIKGIQPVRQLASPPHFLYFYSLHFQKKLVCHF
jgi:hypothetical protein